MNELMKVVERFYEDLHINNASPMSPADSTKLVGKVPTVTQDDVEKILKETETRSCGL